MTINKQQLSTQTKVFDMNDDNWKANHPSGNWNKSRNNNNNNNTCVSFIIHNSPWKMVPHLVEFSLGFIPESNALLLLQHGTQQFLPPVLNRILFGVPFFASVFSAMVIYTSLVLKTGNEVAWIRSMSSALSQPWLCSLKPRLTTVELVQSDLLY